MSFFNDLNNCKSLGDYQLLFDYEFESISKKTIYKSNPDKFNTRVKRLLSDVHEHMRQNNVDGYIVVPTFEDVNTYKSFDFKDISFYKQLLYWVSPVVITLGLILILGSIIKINNVSGHSMDPTLKDKSYIVSNKFSKINRFDIVVANELDSNGKPYGVVKRVIGMPGDVIEYNNDVLKINGSEYDESYLKNYLDKFKNGELYLEYSYDEDMQNRAKSSPSFTVQEFNSSTGERNSDITSFKVEVPITGYFLMGDNRLVSKDSRQLGAFPRENIVGKVVISNIGN